MSEVEADADAYTNICMYGSLGEQTSQPLSKGSWFEPLHLLMPWDGCASWLCHLGIFIYIFSAAVHFSCPTRMNLIKKVLGNTKFKWNPKAFVLSFFVTHRSLLKHAYIIFTPLNHFYLVKLRFTGVYIIFLISAQNHTFWVLFRVPTIYFLSRNTKNIRIFIWKLSDFGGEIFNIFE